MNRLDEIIFNQNDSKKYILKSFLKGLFITFGLILIITGFKIDLLKFKLSLIVLGCLIAAIGLFVGYLFFRGLKGVVKDERLLKVHSYAYSYSWSLTFYIVLILLMFVQFDIIIINSFNLLLIIVLLMLISFAGFSLYFNSNKDF